MVRTTAQTISCGVENHILGANRPYSADNEHSVRKPCPHLTCERRPMRKPPLYLDTHMHVYAYVSTYGTRLLVIVNQADQEQGEDIVHDIEGGQLTDGGEEERPQCANQHVVGLDLVR